MNNKLAPIEYKNQRIMTTKILSEQYGTEETNIQNYKLEGQVLKDFKKSLPAESMEPLKYAPQLILWTDRGAARHAKVLEIDEAWEVYEDLEDTYFKVRELKEEIELLSAKEEIQELKSTVSEFKRLTEEAKLQYKPSHKRKLDYSNIIKSLTYTKEEYEAVKDWLFATLNIDKWEDTCIDDTSRIVDIITTVSKLLTIKRFEQLQLF